ncbi:hypothetical protein KDRO_B02260 [Kluyveromyces lactis]|nr:hypothetical protein KDRO_B02260 [Kluyveromyces lactis]
MQYFTKDASLVCTYDELQKTNTGNIKLRRLKTLSISRLFSRSKTTRLRNRGTRNKQAKFEGSDLNKLERFIYSERFMPCVIFIICIVTLLHLILTRLINMFQEVVKYHFYANLFGMGWDWYSKWNWIVLHMLEKFV